MRVQGKHIQDALYKALKIRKSSENKGIYPISIIDFVEKQGIETRFVEATSLEGMYCKEPGPLILLGTHRSIGRQNYTCAHEFGHHVFNHGTKVDKLDNKQNNQEELQANTFAAYFLMPPTQITQSFRIRDWNVEHTTPLQIYKIATYFGVGYTSLVYQMSNALKSYQYLNTQKFLSTNPKEIKFQITKMEITSELICVDHYWKGRPIDLRIGDYIVLPSKTNINGDLLKYIKRIEDGDLFIAVGSGITKLTLESWSSFLRISKASYIGLGKYRHLED